MPRLDRYQDPRVIDALAGDYVLGTMGGRARRRFSQLMAERAYIEQAVLEWERHLNALANQVAPVAPHPRVWRGIRREISADGRRRRRKSFWSSLSLWRATTFMAVVVLAGVLAYQTITPPAVAPPPLIRVALPTKAAVLVNDKRAAMIVATVTQHPQRLLIIMMQKPQVAADKDLELWAIPQTGEAPVSMGVLSKGQKTLIQLNERDLGVIPKTGVLAISREPEGGSTTGAPTGPVIYQGKLVTL